MRVRTRISSDQANETPTRDTRRPASTTPGTRRPNVERVSPTPSKSPYRLAPANSPTPRESPVPSSQSSKLSAATLRRIASTSTRDKSGTIAERVDPPSRSSSIATTPRKLTSRKLTRPDLFPKAQEQSPQEKPPQELASSNLLASRCEELEAQLKLHERSNAELLAERDMFREKASKLESDFLQSNALATDLSSKAQSLQNRAVELEAKCAQLSKDNTSLAAKCDALQSRIQILENEPKQIEQSSATTATALLEAELGLLRARISDLETERRDFGAAAAESKIRFESESTELRAVVSKMEAERALEQQRVSELVQRCDGLRGEIEALKAKLVEQAQEAVSMKERLSAEFALAESSRVSELKLVQASLADTQARLTETSTELAKFKDASRVSMESYNSESTKRTSLVLDGSDSDGEEIRPRFIARPRAKPVRAPVQKDVSATAVVPNVPVSVSGNAPQESSDAGAGTARSITKQMEGNKLFVKMRNAIDDREKRKLYRHFRSSEHKTCWTEELVQHPLVMRLGTVAS